MTKSRIPTAVILAGGRSSRMGGNSKALLELGGRPLLSYVIDSMRKQSDSLLLNCGAGSSELENFGLPLVPDLLPGYRGPLTGLYSTLQYLSDIGQDSGVVLCPCDAPFIPHNLVQKLLAADPADEKPAVAVSYQGVLQPTFSLWHQHHLPVIRETVVEQGFGGLKYLFNSLPHRIIEWPPGTPPPFFNINTPDDLKTASMWLD